MNEDKLGINIPAVEEQIGLTFKNRALLAQVFIHDSYLNENPSQGVESNERLEFLGDAVIGLAVAENLFKQSSANEAQLTERRKAIVNQHALALVTRKLNLGSHLMLSRSEKKQKWRENEKILEGCLEALVGAIFVQFGYEKASPFVTRTISDAQITQSNNQLF